MADAEGNEFCIGSFHRTKVRRPDTSGTVISRSVLVAELEVCAPRSTKVLSPTEGFTRPVSATDVLRHKHYDEGVDADGPRNVSAAIQI